MHGSNKQVQSSERCKESSLVLYWVVATHFSRGLHQHSQNRNQGSENLFFKNNLVSSGGHLFFFLKIAKFVVSWGSFSRESCCCVLFGQNLLFMCIFGSKKRFHVIILIKIRFSYNVL